MFVFAAASGVNARSFETISAIIARPSGVVPNSTTFTDGDACSSLCAISTTSAYRPVSFQPVFSLVVSKSAGDAFVLAVNAAASFAAGGSYAECGAIASCAPAAATTNSTQKISFRTRNSSGNRTAKLLAQTTSGKLRRQAFSTKLPNAAECFSTHRILN